MDLSKLTYTKNDSGKEEREPVRKPDAEERKVTSEGVSSEIPLDYSKPEGTRSTNLVFVISGGVKRERDFLKEMIRQGVFHSLRVAFLSKVGQGLMPFQMQELWKEISETGQFSIGMQRYNLEAMDKVYLLSDVDEFYDQLVKIVSEKSATDQGEWIISNPCFEIWLYYCYRNAPMSDLAEITQEACDKRSKKLKELGSALVPGGLNPLLAFEHMENGIIHSREHYAEDENKIPLLFSTQMHEMAQYLVDTLNSKDEEYTRYVKQKELWRNKFRNMHS